MVKNGIIYYIFVSVIRGFLKIGSKQSYEGTEDDLLDQVRKAINDVRPESIVEPENIGKKVIDNVEDHSTDTKRGEIN